jgi:thymidylate synthase
VSDVGLCCALTQRSADVFLGLPFNIASYAVLTRMIAHVCGLACDKLVIHLGDTHVYSNHVDQCMTQLQNKIHNFPTLRITKSTTSIDELVYEDFVVDNYVCNPSIRAPMAA